jgi:crotonobetainyl-CoA:carnitine CoA-transferase CaiB-like acyl-CoA transferase
VATTGAGLPASDIHFDNQVAIITGARRGEYFVGAQDRALSTGVIYSPDEVLADHQFVERGFPVQVHHDDLGRDLTYPSAPYRFQRTPWRISRRAPHLGKRSDQVLGPLRMLSTAEEAWST